MSSKSERTEKPTARRQRDARKKGQVARTKDLTQAATLAALVTTVSWTSATGFARLGEAVEQGMERMVEGTGEIVTGTMTGLFVVGGRTVALVVGPIAFGVMTMVVVSQSIQGGWVFSTDALGIKWSKLSPMNGLKRLGLLRGGVELIKVLIVVSAVAWVSWNAIWGLLNDSPRLARLAPLETLAIGWEAAETLIWQVVMLLLLVALADYGVQRRRLTDSLMMTKREVTDDSRLSEGSPETKARVRRLQREMSRNRMLSDVSRATVVITNPTEYAVALEYDRDQLPAPRVLAKGRDVLARRIREVAREHDIPIVENPPLARAIYSGTEVGDFIPQALFDAVAEVIVYLVRLKQIVL